MTGLYENIYEIQNDPVLTFLLRAPKIILGPLEKQIAAAMPDQGAKIKVKGLCDKLEIKGTTFSKYRERLINKGVCIAPEYGYIALALPRFKNIIASYDIGA